MAGNATVLEPLPELLRVYHSADLIFWTLSRSLEHQVFSEKLVRVGDTVLRTFAVGEFFHRFRPNARDFRQVSRNGLG